MFLRVNFKTDIMRKVEICSLKYAYWCMTSNKKPIDNHIFSIVYLYREGIFIFHEYFNSKLKNGAGIIVKLYIFLQTH